MMTRAIGVEDMTGVESMTDITGITDMTDMTDMTSAPQRAARELVEVISAQLSSGQLSAAEGQRRSLELSDIQSRLIEELSAMAPSSATPHTTLGWPALLKRLNAPLELASGLSELERLHQASALFIGDHPVDGWGRCYEYFESVRAHFDALETLNARVAEDPEYFARALEALKLRAASLSIHLI